MPGRDDEDDDETLIADLHPSDDHDDGDATLVAAPLPRVAPRGPLPPAAGLPPARMPPPPAAGAPPRTAPPPPQAFRPPPTMGAPTPAPPVQTRRPPADASLDRRALPFAVGAQAPLVSESVAPPRPPDFQPVTRTQEMPNVSHGVAPAPRQAPPSVPAPPLRTAPPPAMQPSAPIQRSAPPPAIQRSAPPPPVPRPPQDSVVVVAPSDATPPLVLRFLLVCGVLTALGLLALIYLEL